MSVTWRGALALIVFAAFGGMTKAQVVPGTAAPALFQADQAATSAIQLVGCETGECGDSGYSDCGSCDLGLGVTPGTGFWSNAQVFAGGEWLSVRSNFSEATAYRDYDVANDVETWHQFNFDYGDSFRVYGGIRLPECGGELRFTYTNFDSGGGFTSPPTPADSVNPAQGAFQSPGELAPGPGDVLFGSADINVDNYDIGFTKTIPLGCPLSCGGCGDCGDGIACSDSCGPCGAVCPAWDVFWSGGLRIANVDSALNYGVVRDPSNTTPARSATSSVNFDGVGLRFGVGGRRYFGRSGLLSAYVKGDISLLLGEVENRFTQIGVDSAISSTQIVPVTEIEAGLTGYLTPNVTMSAGYMLSAWHDLGHRTEYNFTASGSQILMMDDANMMTFDGFFLRGEVAY